jgi:hypothetical protein
MSIGLLTSALTLLLLGAALVLLGLDWWQPSTRDLLEYVIGGALLVAATVYGLFRYVGRRRDE